MAHPKLATVFNRSLLAASTAALIAGPLAVAGSAQSLETVDETAKKTVDLTCDEAKKTEDLELIAEFCDEDELSGPLAKATEEARARLEKEAKTTTDTVEKTTGVKTPSDPTGGGGGGGGGDEGDDGGSGGSTPDSAPTGTVLPPSGGSEQKAPAKKPAGSRQVRNQGEQPRGISGIGGPGGSAGGYGSGSYSGMRSNSALTLQPFASPLVSVPPVYELPQVAQEMFGLGDEAVAVTEDPMVAMAGDSTATSAYSPTGYSATPADPSGWLAASATGLIMLLGAAHALNGARTPKRKRA